MITFKNPMDITKIDRNDPAYDLVLEFLKHLMITADDNCQCWCPDSQGFLIKLEPGDENRNLSPEWDAMFIQSPFEGVIYRDGFYCATVLLNNDFGLIWLVEDAPWIDGQIRDILEENLDSKTEGFQPSYK